MAAKGGGQNPMGLDKPGAEIVEETVMCGPAVHQKNGGAFAVIGVGHGRPVWQSAHRQTGFPLSEPLFGLIFSLSCPPLYRRLET